MDSPVHIEVKGVNENGDTVYYEVELLSGTVTVDGHCKFIGEEE